MAATDRVTWSLRASGPAVGLTLPAKFEINIPLLSSGNFDATDAALTTLQGALANLTLAIIAKRSVAAGNSISTAVPAVTANRSQKFILTSLDTNGREFTSTIPAADTSGTNVITGTNAVSLAATNWAAFKTAYDAIAVSPASDALTLTKAVLAGRRA